MQEIMLFSRSMRKHSFGALGVRHLYIQIWQFELIFVDVFFYTQGEALFQSTYQFFAH